MCHLRCNLCGQQFHRRDYYQRHLRAVHGAQDPGPGRLVLPEGVILLGEESQEALSLARDHPDSV